VFAFNRFAGRNAEGTALQALRSPLIAVALCTLASLALQEKALSAPRDLRAETDRQAAAAPLLPMQVAQLPAAARKPSKTKLVEFENAPFPFEGVDPRTGRPFIDADPTGRPGRATRGGFKSEDQTYADQRVLLHIPEGFDVRRPAVIVVFFHGHRATIASDVLTRQRVAEQISLSLANAVLVAPQFAVNAADSSAGSFWEPELFRLFLEETSEQLALLNGEPGTTRIFDRMPVIIIGYSGGYSPTAWAIHHSSSNKRLRGVVLLDALYGELDKFETWIRSDRSRFFVSAYLGSTRAKNLELQRTLAEQNIPIRTSFEPQLRPGSVIFIAGGADERHSDFVTQAWATNPIADLLNRLPEYRR
jgi:hypothetical protein